MRWYKQEAVRRTSDRQRASVSVTGGGSWGSRQVQPEASSHHQGCQDPSVVWTTVLPAWGKMGRQKGQGCQSCQEKKIAEGTAGVAIVTGIVT